MRILLSITALTLLLAACGGGDNAPGNGATASNDAGAGGADAGEPDPSPWLMVEAREGDDGFSWHLAGRDKAVTPEDVETALKEYATKTDESAGLSGADPETGLSTNPVYFKARPAVSSQAFLALIELMVGAKVWRAYAELNDGKSFERREWVELPRDEGLSRNAPMYVSASMRVERVRDKLSYRIGPEPGTTELISGSSTDVAKLGEDFDGATYMKIRDAIRVKVDSIRSPEGDRLDKIEIIPGDPMASGDNYPSWGVLFVAIDACRRVHDAREGQPLQTSFRFMDALGRYD